MGLKWDNIKRDLSYIVPMAVISYLTFVDFRPEYRIHGALFFSLMYAFNTGFVVFLFRNTTLEDMKETGVEAKKNTIKHWKAFRKAIYTIFMSIKRLPRRWYE